MSTDDKPGIEHLDNAFVADLAGDQLDLAISEYENALALGIPPDKEIVARYSLGKVYSQRAFQTDLPQEQIVQLPDWRRAEQEMEKALTLDRAGIGYFSTPLGRSLLGRFDLICSYAGTAIGKQDPRAAIEYLESRVEMCEYLSSSPLLDSLLELGAYQFDIDNRERAVASWQRIVSAEPVGLPGLEDDSREKGIREHAAENIQTAQSPAKDTPSRSGCLGVVAALCCIVLFLCCN